jgi:hypothetical protein
MYLCLIHLDVYVFVLLTVGDFVRYFSYSVLKSNEIDN